MMKRRYSAIAALVPLCAILLTTGCSGHMTLLDPKGPVGAGDKFVMVTAFGLMLIVVIPVFFMTFLFAWKYRASNKKATYAPKWAHSGKIEAVVWLVPALIITALGLLVWRTTHTLSPYRAIASAQKPVTIEAVAMDWKWMFIYPDQHIATVNKIVFPSNVPVHFRITSDTVMSSFFIPRLGSQIYAMAGMQTHLNLLASEDGIYTGRNFQFSGPGYASMHFQAVATSAKNFQDWVAKVKHSGRQLDLAAFKRLEKPTTDEPVSYYATVRPHLFDYIIGKYMANKPGNTTANVQRGVSSHAG